MSDRQNATASRVQIILCANRDDADAFAAAGFRSVRVVTKPESVLAFSPEHGEYVVDLQLTMFDLYVLAFPSGHEDLRDGVALRLGDLKCRWVQWGDGSRSAVETLRSGGVEALRNVVACARRMWTDEVCTMADVPDEAPQKTYATGFRGLDDHGFRLVRPAFMPVVGPYGSGKSVLLRQLAANLWRLHGWRTLITAFEEKVKPRFQRDLRRHMIGSEGYDSLGELHWTPKMSSQWTPADIETADAAIDKAFRFLRRPRKALLDANRLFDRIEYAARVYGIDVVIIDPVNEIDHQVPKGDTKTEYMGRFIIDLKQLADDYNLLMIVAAHPPKEGVEKRKSRTHLMTLNDAADTAHYGNKADIGWCVWRPHTEGATYLHIDKLKDHETMGKPTLARLDHDMRFNSFSVSRVGYELHAEINE